MFTYSIKRAREIGKFRAAVVKRRLRNLFKVDRLQIILVAKKIYIYASQLFISRMPKMRAIPQLVSAPLNPIPIAEHFRRSHPPCETAWHEARAELLFCCCLFAVVVAFAVG